MLVTSPTGIPAIYAEVRGGAIKDSYALDWADSTWAPRWNLGYGTAYLRPVHSTEGRRAMVFTEINGFEHPTLGTRAWLLLVEDLGAGPSAPDTVFHVWAGHWSYSAAWSARRKWVAFGDQVGLRLFYSDTARVWRELDVPGYCDAGVALGAVDDTTALLVWGHTFDRLRWGYVRGTRFEEGPPPPGLETFSATPLVRPRPSGGWWVVWGSGVNHASIATLIGTTWSERESLHCAYQPPGPHYALGQPELGDDGTERPWVGWSAADWNFARYPFCLASPSDSGYELAVEAPTHPQAFLPKMTRDRNGDVWVAYYTFNIEGMFWFHSYVRATAASLAATGSTAARTVAWRLSEPAPGSWWAVLRAPPGGALEEVARVPAGDGVEVAWLDDAPAPDTLRYRVRRESVDRRYEWTSDEAVWALDPTPALVSLLHAETGPDRVRLVWAGAGAGALAAAVERRTETEDWRALGAALPDGPDRLAYVDTTVRPGARFAYRLAWTEDGVERRTPEAWVEVPRALELALEGLRPNPSAGRPQVAFTLPAAGRAGIELLDVAGRRVLRHDAGMLPAGRHVVDLADAARLAPGVYLVRLESGGRMVQARGVLVR